MALPNKQELESDIARLLACARDQGRLSQLTVRIVIRELAELHGVKEDIFHGGTYKPFIKDTVYTTMQSFEGVSGGAAEAPETKGEKLDGAEKAGKRKRGSARSSNEELAEDGDVSENETPSSKKISARSKSSKANDHSKVGKPAKSGKTSKKPESESKYKSKAIIQSSDGEVAPVTGARKSAGSPKKVKAKPSQKSPPTKPKQQQRDGSDVEMDTSEVAGPSNLGSKPKPAIQSPKPAHSKGKERDPMESELSSVIDDPPTKPKKEPANLPKEKIKRGKKEPLSKDEEMVNKLKGIVLACGMRKVWKKEFKGLDKPSQQIKRLHSILGDLGMTPRYSLEKAKAIREEREMAQELKDVQEFDRATKRRGKGQCSSHQSAESNGEDDNEENMPTRKRRNARASIMAFLQDQSEEE